MLQKITLQAIDAQSRSSIFEPLEALCSEMIYDMELNGEPHGDSLNKLTTMISDRFGLSIDPSYIKGMANAFVYLPTLTEANTFDPTGLFQNPSESVKSCLAAINKNGGDNTGWVDIAKAKVGGMFSHITCQMSIGTGLFKGTFTAGEVAAILLHEIGHIFTYFDMLGTVMTVNTIVKDGLARVLNEKDSKVKVLKFERFKNELEKKIKQKIQVDPAEMIDFSDDKVMTIFFGQYVSGFISDQLTHYMDFSASEREADLFAARCGAGPDLAAAIGKLNNFGFTYPVTFMNIAMTVLLAFIVISGSPFIVLCNSATLWVIYIMSLMALVFKTSSYQLTSKGRIQDIRRGIISQLKDLQRQNNTKEIQDLLEAYSDNEKYFDRNYLLSRMPILEVFAAIISPGYRARKKDEKTYALVESLMNNDLYLRAIQLENSL